MVNLEDFERYCLSKKETTSGYPFGEGALVFKVANKMFALWSLPDDPPEVNLKCDPELAVTLRNTYDAVRPGYHMNKEHWNTVVLDGTIPDQEIYVMIDHSYERVVMGMKKADRLRLLGDDTVN